MSTEMGEYIVGAYLKLFLNCEFIIYNVRRQEGGLRGLNEIDVIGLDLDNKIAYICEVTTHIRGLLYKNNVETVERVKKKYQIQRKYAREYLQDFGEHHFMFWSPIVPEGYITEGLRKIRGLELVINKEYSACVDELKKKAKEMSNDIGNPFFRILQVLMRLKPISSE